MYIPPTRWNTSVGPVVSWHEIDAPTRPLLTVSISLACEVLPRVSAKTAGLAHPEKFHRPKTVVVVATESGDCLRLFNSALVPLLLPLLRWGAVVSGGLVLLVLRFLSMVRRAGENDIYFPSFLHCGRLRPHITADLRQDGREKLTIAIQQIDLE